jgi:ribonuclease HII
LTGVSENCRLNNQGLPVDNIDKGVDRQMRDKSIKDIEKYLSEKKGLTSEELKRLVEDERKGVQVLLQRFLNRQEKEKALVEQYQRMTAFENKCYERGLKMVAGIDEAGRGPLAGPVVAAAVILNPEVPIIGLNDSKQLSKGQRHGFVEQIKEHALSIGVGIVSAKEIDEINIYQASKLAMEKAVQALEIKPDALLIDAMKIDLPIKQASIIKGDARSVSIAAASIIAKETRDAIMEDLNRHYPGYEFHKHMGYGTQAHLEAVRRLGPCPEHRLSFAPFRTG